MSGPSSTTPWQRVQGWIGELRGRVEESDVSKRELRDAARLAVQSAFAAAASFLVLRTVVSDEVFVGVLSAVFVIQPSVGDTLGSAKQRVVATVVGCAIGVVCLATLPQGYGTAVALALSMLLMNAVAGLRPDWRYGVVAAVALSMGSEQDLWESALARCGSIAIGAVVGLVTSLCVWPDSAFERSQRHLRSALRACAERLDTAIDRLREDSDDSGRGARRRFHSEYEGARGAAAVLRGGDSDCVERQVTHVERLYNSALFVHRVAQESNLLDTEDEGLAQRIDAVRDEACTVCRALADDELEQDDPLTTMSEALSRARTDLDELDGDEEEQVRASAVLFALGEVRDNLSDLVEAFGDCPARRSPLDRLRALLG